MKGNIYLYAMMILLLAIIAVFMINFTSNIVPIEQSRKGSIIEISQYSFGFTPNFIELKKGETVTLKIKSRGGNHNFSIDQYEINTDIKDGQEVSIILKAEKEGEFIFYDPLPGHNESGENGILVVRS